MLSVGDRQVRPGRDPISVTEKPRAFHFHPKLANGGQKNNGTDTERNHSTDNLLQHSKPAYRLNSNISGVEALAHWERAQVRLS